MKDTTLIRLIGLAAIQPIALAAALLTASTQAAPEHSGSLKDQASVPKLQEAGVPVLEVGKPLEPAAPATLPQPESEIIKLTHTYESSLRDLAEKAQQIVQGMPDKPDELSRNFGDLRNVLIDARTNLSAIIARKPEIDAQAKTVLKSAADVRQGFLDMAKKIEDRLQQIRQMQTDNPKALEAAANALEGIKAACQRGESAVGHCDNWCLKLTAKAKPFSPSWSFILRFSISLSRPVTSTKRGSDSQPAMLRWSKR